MPGPSKTNTEVRCRCWPKPRSSCRASSGASWKQQPKPRIMLLSCDLPSYMLPLVCRYGSQPASRISQCHCDGRDCAQRSPTPIRASDHAVQAPTLASRCSDSHRGAQILFSWLVVYKLAPPSAVVARAQTQCLPLVVHVRACKPSAWLADSLWEYTGCSPACRHVRCS